MTKQQTPALRHTHLHEILANPSLLATNPVKYASAIIDRIDQLLSSQLNAIIHARDFSSLEANWRGLHFLVSNTELGDQLKIRVIDLSKDELYKSIGQGFDNQNFLYRKIYLQPYNEPGEAPFTCFVADYYFNHHSEDLGLLENLAKIAAMAFTPVISGTDASLLNFGSWQELPPGQAEVEAYFSDRSLDAWQKLRDSENSRYLGLTVPRTLARAPYRAGKSQADQFDFHEDLSAGVSAYTWSNSAYCMAFAIMRAFKQFGWSTRFRGVESGGLISDLPTRTLPSDDGNNQSICPTEISLSERNEHVLAKQGLLPLLHRKNTADAAFFGAQSFHKPHEFENTDATANANLLSQMAYLMPICNFVHYIKCIARDRRDQTSDIGQLQEYLQGWLSQYVVDDPEWWNKRIMPKKPLAAATITLSEFPGVSTMCEANLAIQPLYQLEGLSKPVSVNFALAIGC